MKNLNISIPVSELDYSELSPEDRLLIDAAKDMTANSYAPYSDFHVGAAIRLDDGSIVGGANQENAAFSSGTCAERSACFNAGANHPRVPMRKIAIAAQTKGLFTEEPISPCGACRQALLEYEAKDGPIQVLLYGRNRIYSLPSVAALLPLAFSEF